MALLECSAVAQELSEAERQAVKVFLQQLYEQSAFAARWELAFAAGVSEANLNEWLSPKGSLPSALNLLRLLQAADALKPSFRAEIPPRRRRSAP